MSYMVLSDSEGMRLMPGRGRPRTGRSVEKKRACRKRYYAKTANLYSRRAWTEEETQLVMEHSIPDSELSVKLGRSLKGIQEKRRRMKKSNQNSL
ncbi:MAG: hypothetical protein LUF29_08655 [Oscillospiraceae bacterium]|nr:hypothetical protein [Oscillospiraceae bacterium]